MKFLAVIVATLVFTLYDCWLFPKARGTGWLVPYRISQIAIQIGLYVGCYLLYGLPCAIAAFLIWWLGVCDILYHPILGFDFWLDYGWSWMWWTPLGMYRSLVNPPLYMTSTEVFWQGATSIPISFILLLI